MLPVLFVCVGLADSVEATRNVGGGDGDGGGAWAAERSPSILFILSVSLSLSLGSDDGAVRSAEISSRSIDGGGGGG